LNKEKVRAEKKKLLFLPQCLRKQGCKAKLGERGFECNSCSEECQIYKIKRMTHMPCFIMPGGSMVARIIAEEKPCAVIGIACLKELELGVVECEKQGVPSVGMPLLSEGCINTLVDLNEVKALLNEVSETVPKKSAKESG
jgi:hypothetical protein